MRSGRVMLAMVAGSFMFVAGLPALAGASGSDTKVTVGSPPGPFPRNKQNEPAVAVALNPANPSILAAGSNEEVDEAPCTSTGCPFIPGVGNSGIYFSTDGGATWTQPTYRGWSDRTGTPHLGPIGTIPNYYEAGLTSDGDPALAFGPRRGSHGFSWSLGARLYYGNLTSAFPGRPGIPPNTEGIAVSHTDDIAAAAAGDNAAWSRPAVASTDLRGHVFSDKEAIWADNAASSPHFGSVYVCWTSYRGTAAFPVELARSTDGGDHWSKPVVIAHSSATDQFDQSFCTIRTNSRGDVYVAFERTSSNGRTGTFQLAVSTDGGTSFSDARPVATFVEPGRLDPAHVAVGDPRFTMDGLAGAREDAGLALDIANGAPTGSDATDAMVMAWSDGRRGLNHEQSLLQVSTDRGAHWSAPVDTTQAGDRPMYTAAGISPNGGDVYVAYDAVLTPWLDNTTRPRVMQGVVRHADVTAGGALSGLATVHRGVPGDPRGSSQNDLTSEFLGDYNYVVATRAAGYAVWNDARQAAVCPAVDAYRASLVTPHPLPKPDVPHQCPAQFGNTDIFGGLYADPTP